MISYSGAKFDLAHGHPPLSDAVLSLSRLGRWNGATKLHWPVLGHLLVVADLLKSQGPQFELAGLTHDVAEGLGLSDISSSLKTDDVRVNEKLLMDRIVRDTYLGGLRLPWDDPAVKRADKLSASAERFLLMDGYSTEGDDDFRAVVHTARYVSQWSLTDWFTPGSEPQRQYIERLEKLVHDLHTLSNPTSWKVYDCSLAANQIYGSGTAYRSGTTTSRPPSASGAVVRVDGPDLLWCSGCGVQHVSGQHTCHPDADPLDGAAI